MPEHLERGPVPDAGSRAGAGPEAVVRPARRGEMPRIRELVSLFPDDLVQDSLPRIPSFFVAESEGTIVGCCALQVYSRRLAEVRSLAVHPDFQGRGIAARLVDACRERGRRRRVRQLFAVTSQPDFFERRGFAVHSGWKTALFADLDDRPRD